MGRSHQMHLKYKLNGFDLFGNHKNIKSCGAQLKTVLNQRAVKPTCPDPFGELVEGGIRSKTPVSTGSAWHYFLK